MKVIDHVNQSISKYPSLFMVNNYEDSKFAVLHQDFIVLGNGMEWAYTPDPKDGGYLTHPIMKETEDGEWVRLYDEPYGKEKCELDPRVFKEKIFYFEEIDVKLAEEGYVFGATSGNVVFESELEELKKKHKACTGRKDYVRGFHTHFYFPCGKTYDQKKDPYPNFSKRYSCFWEIDPKLIKEDWRLAGIEHLKYWQDYFDDPERVKSYHYYKNPKSFKKWVVSRYKERPEQYPDWVEAVRKDYRLPKFDGNNFEEMSEIRWERELKKTKEFLSETIERLESV